MVAWGGLTSSVCALTDVVWLRVEWTVNLGRSKRRNGVDIYISIYFGESALSWPICFYLFYFCDF